ncbi:MAG TPA: DinB family protein [Ktedonobacteraceae bacterium]|nr:DinB family protein [Ktedonobacteraceae bacterium]
MKEQALHLAPFYKGWDEYQQKLVKALAPLSQEQLDLRASGTLRSVSNLVRHIIGARARWLHYVLREDDESTFDLMEWDRPDQPTRSASELISALETSWRVLQNALNRWTIADLEEILHDIGEDGEDETFTRQWVIWHLIEHDLHHGGEFSFLLGMHDLPGIDL